MFEFIKNFFSKKHKNNHKEKYNNHEEAVIISCFYNPQNNPYRLLAFNRWYQSVKHLNVRVVECVVDKSKPQLPVDPNISVVYSDSMLWHKEALLNNIVKNLPKQFKYVFWVDADVLFTNNNWLVDSVNCLQTAKVVQPFQYCIHLEQNEVKPSFDIEEARKTAHFPKEKNGTKVMWHSFAYNYVANQELFNDKNYDVHGHVGFAWGARREVLEQCPLYDRGLVGGADHIVAHAAVGQINHECIARAFSDEIDEVNNWSKEFYDLVQGSLGYVPGDLYHIWHGDINKREYLKRIKDYTPISKNIKNRDENGLYVADKGKDKYVRKYMSKREVKFGDYDNFSEDLIFDFVQNMGYSIYDLIRIFGESQLYTHYDEKQGYIIGVDVAEEQVDDPVNFEEYPVQDNVLQEESKSQDLNDSPLQEESNSQDLNDSNSQDCENFS